MGFHGEKMENVTIVEKILCSLVSKFDHVACSIKESKDIDALSLDKLHSFLLLHEEFTAISECVFREKKRQNI